MENKLNKTIIKSIFRGVECFNKVYKAKKNNKKKIK